MSLLRQKELTMPKRSVIDKQAIKAVVSQFHDGVSVEDLLTRLKTDLSRRTLQRRLAEMVQSGMLEREGSTRATRYYAPISPDEVPGLPPRLQREAQGELFVPLSKKGEEIRRYVRQPYECRRPVGYNRDFLDSYRPNNTHYLSRSERNHLRTIGRPDSTERPAGTYARQILNRLLIDLAWNSSRLEGNTYSLLDTQRLIELGEAAEGKDQLEAQMILNHKDAIEFLVESAVEVTFNRITILNLHGLLSNNLLKDPDASGRLRRISVGISSSLYHPPETPQVIEECFNRLLSVASKIDDPFEQSFFVMVQLPYLQPFDDINKRVSRLACNIPFIKQNFAPLSFVSVPDHAYSDAVLDVYELNRVELLRDVFILFYSPERRV